MSESASIQPNKTVLIMLGIIIVLLVVMVGVIMAKSSSDVPSPTAAAPASTPTGDTGAGAPAGTAAPAADFDPTTATKVPEGTSPEDFVAAYYDAILAGDWETAYAAQPAHKMTGSVADFQAQIEGYGVVSYTVTGSSEQGEQYLVEVDQETGSYGTFTNQWVFMKADGGWVVQDKAVTGMK